MAGSALLLLAVTALPALAKTFAGNQNASLPGFSPPGGVFTNALSLVLSAQSSGAVIRYTLDGSEPTNSSAVYSAPLQLAGSTIVKAQVFPANSAPGPTLSQSYTLLEPNLWSFDSNLPLVILNTFGQDIPHSSKVPVSARFIQPVDGRATLTGPADFDGRGLINVRGHTSLRYPKHSFHLKTRDDAGHPLKTPLLGFPKETDWVLYAPYPDKTLMRDVLAFELSNQMGRYATRTKFVEVFADESDGKLSRRNYLGVYVLEEKIKRDKHRVDVEKLTADDNAEPGITGGYVFKKDHADQVEMGRPNQLGMPMGHGGFTMNRPGYPTGPGGFPADPQGFLPPERGFAGNPDFQLPQGIRFLQPGQFVPGRGVTPPNFPLAPLNRPKVGPDGGQGERRDVFVPDRFQFFQNQGGDRTGREGVAGTEAIFYTRQANQFFYVEPKPGEITPAQKTWLKNHLDQFESVLYGPNFTDPAKGYAAFIDADSFIDQHLLIEVTKNIDGFRFSTFFYKERGDKIKMGPAWDWNLSFGNANGKQGELPEYWYWPQLDDQQYTWYRRLFEDPDFAQKYVDRWGELRTNVLASANLLKRVDELAGLLGESQRRNFRRWRIMGQMVWPNAYVGYTYQDEIDWMKQWIQARLEWIDRQFVSAPVFSFPDGHFVPGAQLVMQAPAGKIYYTADGSDPRSPGGGISPKAQLYTSPPTIQTGTTFFARALNGNRWSSPSHVAYPAEAVHTRSAN